MRRLRKLQDALPGQQATAAVLRPERHCRRSSSPVMTPHTEKRHRSPRRSSQGQRPRKRHRMRSRRSPSPRCQTSAPPRGMTPRVTGANRVPCGKQRSIPILTPAASAPARQLQRHPSVDVHWEVRGHMPVPAWQSKATACSMRPAPAPARRMAEQGGMPFREEPKPSKAPQRRIMAAHAPIVAARLVSGGRQPEALRKHATALLAEALAKEAHSNATRQMLAAKEAARVATERAVIAQGLLDITGQSVTPEGVVARTDSREAPRARGRTKRRGQRCRPSRRPNASSSATPRAVAQPHHGSAVAAQQRAKAWPTSKVQNYRA